MKSALPKVLHRAGELSLIERVLRTPRSRSNPPQSWWLLATRRTRCRARAWETAGPAVCIAGATAGHRPCAAAGGTALAGRARNGGAAVWGRAVAHGDDAPRLVESASCTRRGGDGADGPGRRPARVRPHRARRRVDRGHRRGQGRDAGSSDGSREINSGIYAFDLEPLFEALSQRRRRQRAAGVLPSGSGADLPHARARRRRR